MLSFLSSRRWRDTPGGKGAPHLHSHPPDPQAAARGAGGQRLRVSRAVVGPHTWHMMSLEPFKPPCGPGVTFPGPSRGHPRPPAPLRQSRDSLTPGLSGGPSAGVHKGRCGLQLPHTKCANHRCACHPVCTAGTDACFPRLQTGSAPAIRWPELHHPQPARHPSLRGGPCPSVSRLEFGPSA